MGVPNSALQGIADSLLSSFTHLAIGTDATAFVATQSALLAETDRFNSLTTSKVTSTVTDDTARFEGTLTAPADRTGLNEVALFNNAVGGDMALRQTYGDLNLQAGDELFIRAQLIVSQA